MTEQMISLAAKMPTKDLMAEARKMAAREDGYATDVLGALLTALDGRIPEPEYIAFCDSL